MKIKFFKKENNFKKKNFAFSPSFCWKFAIGGAFIMILLSSFFGYRLFTQTNQEPVLSVMNESGQVPTVKKNRIEKILNYFLEREQKSAKILNSRAPVIDPSL
jgi:hypothetical protein